MDEAELRVARDRPLRFHRLVYLVEGEEVTIGRPDTDSYAIFPPDGAELVRRLESGATAAEAAQWYESEYGERIDVDHVLAALDELGFLRAEDAQPVAAERVRWQRLGAALFSRPAGVAYALLVGWALYATARSPDLLPDYHHLLFTEYFTLIELALLVAAVPLLALHECFHALAGRRLGLRSKVRFGRRFYFLVLETSLDGLVAVPRRRRYLPILAGMLADLLALAALTLVADLTRGPGGEFSLAGRICLAAAYTTVIRLLWQFFFYLRTDLYVLVTTLLGCVDLHTTAKRMLGNRVRRGLDRVRGVFGRAPSDRPLADESAFHPIDRRIGSWYSWLMLVGYSVSLGTFVLAGAPAAYLLFSGALGRFGDGATSAQQLLDSAVFLGTNLAQLAAVGWLALLERRQRPTSQSRHVIAA